MEDHNLLFGKRFFAGVGGARSAWVGARRATNFIYYEKGYKQVNEKKKSRDVCLAMKKSTTGQQCTQTRG